MTTITMNVQGINCGGCTAKIEKQLSAMDMVHSFSVSLEQKTVQVQGERITGVQLKKAIEELGFSVESFQKSEGSQARGKD